MRINKNSYLKLLNHSFKQHDLCSVTGINKVLYGEGLKNVK